VTHVIHLVANAARASLWATALLLVLGFVLHHAGDDEDVFAVRDVDATYRFVVPGGREARSRPPVPAPVRVPEPADVTAPLPVIVPAPLTSVSAGLWGRFA